MASWTGCWTWATRGRRRARCAGCWFAVPTAPGCWRKSPPPSAATATTSRWTWSSTVHMHGCLHVHAGVRQSPVAAAGAGTRCSKLCVAAAIRVQLFVVRLCTLAGRLQCHVDLVSLCSSTKNSPQATHGSSRLKPHLCAATAGVHWQRLQRRRHERLLDAVCRRGRPHPARRHGAFETLKTHIPSRHRHKALPDTPRPWPRSGRITRRARGSHVSELKKRSACVNVRLHTDTIELQLSCAPHLVMT